MKKVLIPTKLDKVAAEYLSGKGYQVVQDSEADLMALCQANTDAEALIVRSEKITPEIIDLLPGLKAIVRAGAGYNTIDIKYARRKNIDVMNTPGANANAVAEEVSEHEHRDEGGGVRQEEAAEQCDDDWEDHLLEL